MKRDPFSPIEMPGPFLVKNLDIYLEQARADKLALHLGDTRDIYEKRAYTLYHIAFQKTYCDMAEAELIVATWHRVLFTNDISKCSFFNEIIYSCI